MASVSNEEIEHEYQRSPENKGDMQKEYIRVILEYEKREEKYKTFVLDLKKQRQLKRIYNFSYLKGRRAYFNKQN